MGLEEYKDKRFGFIQGGGEMGSLTRSCNWSETSIGTPDQWPHSLRTTLGILLHSSFPMFLFWGEDLICFYNDAYRPSLGADGKHPAVGKKGRQVWPEIWGFIGPIIEQVKATGEPVWFEDQLLPIYRNGAVEDVYWTFSYSPVFGDDGEISGVFVTCTETTNKVQGINKLIQSESRFQNLIRDATVGIIVLTGEDMVVEVVNEAYGKLINQDHEAMIGRPLFKIIPETEPYFRSIIDQVRKTGIPFYLYNHPYFVFVNEVKREGILNLVYQPYKRNDGSIAGVMILCHDVTDQVSSSKKVEESEEKVRAIIAIAPFPIGVYIGREMRIEMANQAILDVWGKGNDVVGKLYADILPELENQEIFRQLDAVFTTGVPFQARNQRVDLIVDHEEKTYFFNYSFTPLRDFDGKIYGVMNSAADVTELNLAKLKVEESGRNLRNIILKAPVAMCIFTGPEFIVEIANERMILLWGKTQEDVLNKPIFEGLPEVKDQGFEKLLQDVFSTGEAFEAQGVPVILPRGDKLEAVYVNFLYEAYREPDGRISGVIAVAVDVTDQVLARQKIEEVVAVRTQELADANRNLQKSNSELSQFAYIASHDLQEPIRKVSTFAQMLENSLPDIDERSMNYLNKIKKSSTRMLTLIRDVLAYSQLSKETEVLKAIDIGDVIRDIIYDLELLIEQKNAQILYDGLPVIYGVPLQIAQLFGNLISNSLKFTRTDIVPVISITCSEIISDDLMNHFIPDPTLYYYHFKVQDNGIGFDQEYAEQIFSIFQRLHGKKEFDGTGIGLAMCKKIAENHGGYIYANSVKNSGTVFHVILPGNKVNRLL